MAELNSIPNQLAISSLNSYPASQSTAFWKMSLEIIATAVLATVLTLSIAFVGGRFLIINRVQPAIAALVDARIEELGTLIEERVRQGVVAGVEDVTSPKTLQRTMTKNQNTLLDAIFGKRP